MYKHAEEDYIKFIYEYGINHDTRVQVKHIATHFDYTEQSVYEMVKRLHDQELVVYKPYQGIQLSKKGLDEAIRMIRSHRIWEVFLQEYLGYSWEDVHHEAELLEHASSDELLKKLYKKLGSPKTCQHGNPIPDFEGNIDIKPMTSLDEVRVGQQFQIQKVLDQTKLLIYLKQLSIELKDVIKMIHKDDFNGMIEIEMSNKKVNISMQTASMIYGNTI